VTISFWVFVSVAGFAVLAGIAAAMWMFHLAVTDGDVIFRGFGIGCCVWIIGWLIGAGFGLYPYQAQYHSWRAHAGIVDRISSRFVATGSGNDAATDQKFVITFKGDPQQYGINDTRAALVHPGDHVRITCIRTHQWGAGVDGYDCRWDQ
jgi:hypothetical protein